MKLELMNCPACNSPLDKKLINPNQPFNCPACNSAIVLTDWTTSGQLVCSKCGAVNPSWNKFCDACRAVLQSGCPFCYTRNRVDATFCKNCGANLQTAWKRQSTWLAEREKHEIERAKNLQKAAQSDRAYLARLLLQLNEPENHAVAIPGILVFGKDAVKPLIDLLLTSDDPDARFGAARALGDIGDKQVVPELIKALQDREEAVRFWAVDALGKLKTSEAVDAIGEILGDRRQSKSIRELAKNVLIQIGTPKALKVLRQESKPQWWPPLM
jgi:ribosomal protein L40E